MTNVQPGWYPDPNDTAKVRWWDGSAWTAHVAEKVVGAASTGAETTAATRRPRRFSRRTSLIVGAAAVLGIALVGGAVNAATLAARSVAGEGAPVAFAATTATAAASTPSRTPTPTPTHTPVVTTRDETATEPVPFERTSVEDSSLPQGQTTVTTAGQNGERTRTYRVTLTDGVETGRELVSDAVTTPPVTEVTSIGTYVAPAAPPPPAAAPGNCDPNYAEACVPIASDVDCVGGKGNGPAYFDGVARVVGRDIYKLDGDGDGWACNG
mgnify:CR=1 FL=1